jgi:hypothetical protein
MMDALSFPNAMFKEKAVVLLVLMKFVNIVFFHSFTVFSR